MDTKDSGFDPNTATGTKDAVDPGTGTLGTGGTPVTAGEGASGSTIGTGSQAGEDRQKSGNYPGPTPGSKDYTAGEDA